MLVVMGPIMEIPVTDLFAAAIIPGILLATLYAAYTTIRCWIDPSLGTCTCHLNLRATSMKEVWIEFFLGLVPPAALVFAALRKYSYLGLQLQQRQLDVGQWDLYF
jgi:TRAP-type mannitol/chloroaromatic compound transport system permease large subunit